MKTIFHAYRFDTGIPSEKIAWEALRCRLVEEVGLSNHMHSHGGNRHYMPRLDGREITLETEYLFNNQWNTAPIDGISESGLRVFDWAQDSLWNAGRENQWLKQGHWLEQTAEMREIRRNRTCCGYCGKQEPAAKGYVFCPHCIDSQFLKSTDLYLTRMRSIDAKRGRPPLTDAERAYLTPLYTQAQLHGTTARGKARLTKDRREVIAEYQRTVSQAAEQADAANWILDRFPNLLENWIYYKGTKVHSIGWRTPLDNDTYEMIREAFETFPFVYEIKLIGGSTVKNARSAAAHGDVVTHLVVQQHRYRKEQLSQETSIAAAKAKLEFLQLNDPDGNYQIETV